MALCRSAGAADLMTLPVELLQRRRSVDRYDAAIVGAGLPGLVCACLLAGAGLRVVVVDRRKRPGGHLQTLSYQGYAIDLAPPIWESPALAQILEAAAVKEHGLVDVASAAVQVAIVGERGLEGAPRVPPIPGTVPSPSALDAVRQILGVPPRVFAALGGLYEEMAAATPEQVEEWRRVELATWLDERALEPAVKTAMLRSVQVAGADDAARASLGAVAQRARASRGRAGLAVPGDNPIPGARGIIQALVDRLIDAGGELRLGTRATGMALDMRAFRALAVQREEQPFTEEILADRCILALATPSLRAVLPEEPDRALAPEVTGPAALLGVAWGIEGDAAFPDAEQAWVVRAVPPVGIDPGTLPLPRAVDFVRASAPAPRLAPPGRAIVLAWTGLDAGAPRDARIVASRVGHLRASLQGLLGGGEAVEWQRHWTLPWSRGDAFAPAAIPCVVPGFTGLFVANEAVEVPGRAGGGLVAAAASARHVADRILSGA
jgi:hypothetical protein